MSTRIYNRLLYWALAVVPFSGLFIVGQVYGAAWFVVFLLLYLFLYRPLLDTQRLLSLGAIKEEDAWRFFVPLAVDRMQYAKALWLG